MTAPNRTTHREWRVRWPSGWAQEYGRDEAHARRAVAHGHHDAMEAGAMTVEHIRRWRWRTVPNPWPDPERVAHPLAHRHGQAVRESCRSRDGDALLEFEDLVIAGSSSIAVLQRGTGGSRAQRRMSETRFCSCQVEPVQLFENWAFCVVGGRACADRR